MHNTAGKMTDGRVSEAAFQNDSRGHYVAPPEEDATPPPGYPRLSCDRPAPGERPLVAGQLFLHGWALADSAEGTVSVSVELGQSFPATQKGLIRDDVAIAFPDHPGAVESGWIARLTTSGLAPGVGEVRVTARDEQGRETSVTRSIDVGPARLYAAWLSARRPLRIAPNDGRAHLFFCLIGSQAPEPTRASLQRQLLQPATTAASDSPDQLRVRIEEFLAGDFDYMVLAPAGDELEPHALSSLAGAAAAEPPPDVIYADEDTRDAHGKRVDPFFKPGWSPELLVELDYVGPFVAISRAAAERALEADPNPPANAYDLLLRLIDSDPVVRRIPDVLCTRASPGARREEERRAGDAAVAALARRRGGGAEIARLTYPGARRVGWKHTGNPLVSIVVATNFGTDLVQRCLDSVRERSAYGEIEVLIVANNLEGPEPDGLREPELKTTTVTYEGDFNYSAINNAGARAASGDYLVFLNDDTEVDSPDWIETLLGQVQQPGVGVVGAKLVYPEGPVQLGGVLLTQDGRGARVLGSGYPSDDPVYHGLFAVARNQVSVSGACMMVSRRLFDGLGGFDEALTVELSDVDFCLRAIEMGRRVVWTPHAVLTHHERGSRGRFEHPRDRSRFIQRWERLLDEGDPYYNPNLSTDDVVDFEIRGVPLDIGEAPPTAESDAEERPSEERFVPETMRGLIKAEHEGRYRWASRAVTGKDVLDAGCGVGYGTQFLAEAGATRVTGLDLSAEAVADATFRAGSQAEFRQGDLLAMPFEDDSFDVVVSFEAIEHVRDSDAVLDEIKRVLRPDGVMILSSPNRNVYPAGNPYHLHEYTPAELEAVVAERFRNSIFYRQQPMVTSLIVADDDFEAHRSADEIDVSVRKIARARRGEELYTIAVAGDGELPDLSGIAVLADTADLKHLLEQVQERDKELSRRMERLVETERTAEAAQARAGDLDQELAVLRDSRSWRLIKPVREAGRLLRSVRRRWH